MKTVYLSENETEKAAEILKCGGIVAIPTETVYGLAANTFDETAIKKIFLAKGRPNDNPLIVHICNIKNIYEVVSEFPEKAKKLADKFWPGPLTMILPKNKSIPNSVTAGMDSVAVRFPKNKIALEIIEKSEVPLVAPSANLSGKPSPTKFEHVKNDMEGKIDAIVNGGDCEFGLESTVISLIDEKPIILRPGAITPADIKSVLGEEIEIDKNVFSKPQTNQKVLSPGMKYTHYSPKAKVFLVKGTTEKYCDFLKDKNENGIFALCYNEDIPFLKIPYISYGKKENPTEQANKLFGALRECDFKKAEIVYAHFEMINEISIAVYNRLIRAAGFNVIEI